MVEVLQTSALPLGYAAIWKSRNATLAGAKVSSISFGGVDRHGRDPYNSGDVMSVSLSKVLLFGLLACLLAAPYVRASAPAPELASDAACRLSRATDCPVSEGDLIHEAFLTSRAVCRTKPQLRDELSIAGPQTVARSCDATTVDPPERLDRPWAPANGRDTYLHIGVLLI